MAPPQIIYLNKGEPEGSAQHSPRELEPNPEPLEFSSLHDLALWIRFPYKKEERRDTRHEAINSISEMRGGPERSGEEARRAATVARLPDPNSTNSGWTPPSPVLSHQRMHNILLVAAE